MLTATKKKVLKNKEEKVKCVESCVRRPKRPPKAVK
jgi:hypothetical protein